MTAAGEQPTPSITEATLEGIAADGIWAPGPTVSPAAAAVATALLAALRGEASGGLPPELERLTAEVRERATIDLPHILTEEGFKLSALSVKLNDGEPHPVVIVPAGWSPLGWLPFLYAYLTLARRGYHVLAYTPRGIGDPALLSTSEGFIDVAGPKDRADGSRVIDYAQDHFAPSSVGFLGESYGSGISQLVAAHDRDARVSAVVALSTWGNLATSLYDNGTRHLAAVNGLIAFTGGDSLEEKFDQETCEVLRDFLAGENLQRVVAWGTERSPEACADLTNERGIPTFVSNTWHESLFPVGQVIEAFTRLTVPKRLNLWIGDHGAPEGPGLAGLLSGVPFPGLREPMREAYDWLDHHLLGADNGVAEWPEVNSQVMFSYRTAPALGGGDRITEPARREPSDSWEAVVAGRELWYLTGTRGTGDGALAETPAADWSRDFSGGEPTAATAMDTILQTGQKEWFGNPKAYDLGKFERSDLLVWSTGPLTGESGVARRIRGTATVRLTVSSTDGDVTLVAYLFDIAPDGAARIITHEPFTLARAPRSGGHSVSWALQPAAYDLPDGHSLALVVNSRDDLYSFVSTEGSTVTVSSPGDGEARLELPLG
ncbi:CocE/NonD family hydrolase [Streptomyces sp. NPDC060322]|uniref:CocE/NonD family hydrolase n=1 Tax=Streptomyces sp. NPDC060322 TaxID=3347097 RepID=UPI003652E4AC